MRKGNSIFETARLQATGCCEANRKESDISFKDIKSVAAKL